MAGGKDEANYCKESQLSTSFFRWHSTVYAGNVMPFVDIHVCAYVAAIYKFSDNEGRAYSQSNVQPGLSQWMKQSRIIEFVMMRKLTSHRISCPAHALREVQGMIKDKQYSRQGDPASSMTCLQRRQRTRGR